MIQRLSIPNPYFEGRNSVYLITTDPLTLIDTGVATDRSFQTLCDGLQQHDVDVQDIKRVILTHKHIDHIGNAWRIQRASGAQVYIHESEQKSLTDVDPTGKRFAELVLEKLRLWQAPTEQMSSRFRSKMPLWTLESAQVQGLSDGQRLETQDGDLEIIHTPGHTMGSICLKYREYLFTGDTVLPDISPNVGGGDMRSSGMLKRYLNSLDKLRQHEGAEVLPGHGAPFRELTQRCQQLKELHDLRLDETEAALRSGASTVFEVAAELFGEMNDIHLVLGCAEANAHLEYLVDQGRVTQKHGNYHCAE